MDEARILRDLYDFNPFWKGLFPSEGRLYHRRQFALLSKLLSFPQMLTLTGLRRTGKTTLLLQLISHLIQNKETSPERICLYQFEEKLSAPKLDDLEAFIRLYIRSILKEDIHTPKRIFFFFDELQFVEGWQSVLKKYYDLNKNIKFIVSGSASLFIKKATRESLAGRAFEEKIRPLSFKEYLSLNPNQTMEPWQNDLNLEGDLKEFMEINKIVYAKNRDIAPDFFETFLVQGQFPEIASWEDISLSFRYIRESIVSKLIEYDIPKLYGFRKTDELGLFFTILAKETGNLFAYENLAREVGVAQNTLKEYMNAFIETSIVEILHNYTKKHRKAKRQLKKSYISSPNLTCALHHLTKENLLNNPMMGYLVETEVINGLKEKHPQASFWNQYSKEVDMIVPFKDQLLPIEVKYKNRIQKEDIKPIRNLLLQKDSPHGIVFTKNEFYKDSTQGKSLYFIPVWMI